MVKNLSRNTFNSTSPSFIESDKRTANSLVPPPPGITPTPNSTNPMYDSACAITLSACKHTSQPPPRVKL